MKTKNFLVGSILFAALTVAPFTPAIAQEYHQWGHFDGVRINDRLDNMHARINSDEEAGIISSLRASDLRHREHSIRMEEDRMKDDHGGMLTGDDVARLNAQIDNLDDNIATAEEP